MSAEAQTATSTRSRRWWVSSRGASIRPCGCGCGQDTDRDFLPGHDVRAMQARVREHFDGSAARFLDWVDALLVTNPATTTGSTTRSATEFTESHGAMSMTRLTLKLWRAYEPCPGCGDSYQSFGPGRLSEDGTAEIRTHDGEDGCGTQIRTIPYFIPDTPGEATAWNFG